MAYNEYQSERIRRVFSQKGIPFEEKKMMGGLCFMVDDKMCCGLLYDKKKETDLLMARVGPEAAEAAMGKDGVLPMDFTGRPMKGFIFVESSAFDLDDDLESWVDRCLAFNPLATSSKNKK